MAPWKLLSLSASWNKHQSWTRLASVSPLLPPSLPSFPPSLSSFFLNSTLFLHIPRILLSLSLLIFLSFHATNNITIETKKRQLCSESLHPERSSHLPHHHARQSREASLQNPEQRSLVTELEQSPSVILGGSEIQFIELFNKASSKIKQQSWK